jgi:hypothetical protein
VNRTTADYFPDSKQAYVKTRRQKRPKALREQPSRQISPQTAEHTGYSEPDYTRWSVEELRAFARQLQLPDAMRKNRGELIEIFDTSRARD